MRNLGMQEIEAVDGAMGGGGPGETDPWATCVLGTAVGGGLMGLSTGPLGGALGAVGGFIVGASQCS